jgi:ATP-dependent RNA helicase RhlB
MPKPEQRLSMLFSATLSLRVHELAYEHMNNPQIVEIAPDKVTVDKVVQAIYHVQNDQKIALLIGLLRKTGASRVLVFVNTKRTAEQVYAFLRTNGFHVEVLSGDVPQRKRQSLIGRIARGELAILVATDVAARGLHIPEVTHVFNYDLPQNAEDYVHRIGRTARAGASGDAISLACEEFVYSLMDIEDYIGHKIPVAAVSDELLVKLEVPPHSKRTARGGMQHKGRPRQRRPRSTAA